MNAPRKALDIISKQKLTLSFMENEKGIGVLPEIVETKDDEGNDTTNWQEVALAQQEAAKQFHGLAKRNFKDLESLKNDSRLKEKSSDIPDKPAKEGFDYADKAYLKASGLNPDEFDFAHEVMVSTGKSLDEVLEAKYFQSELKERREAKASKDAIPTGAKRSASAPATQVDYWIGKGELPPADQVDLRREVVKARMKIEGSKSNFTDRPIGNIR